MNEQELMKEVREREGRNIAIYPKRFYHSYKDNPDGTKRPIEMVLIGKRGTTIPFEIAKRWKDLPDIERHALQPYYEAWKRNESAPVVGIPLESWAADPEMVEVLKQASIVTVEQFAALEDHNLVRLNIANGREKQARAKAFLDNKSNNVSAVELAALRSDRDSLRKEVADLRALIEKHAIKRGPGRPKKTQPSEAVN